MERQPETRPLLSGDKPPERDSFERYSLVVLALTILAAAWLRFHLLTAKSFWFDEGFSVGVARLGWADFLQLLWHREANMAVYYLLLRLWTKFGISEVFVRSLSVVFALATIPIIYMLGARLFRPRTGLIAAVLLAVNAFSVRYSQEARGYTLLVLLVALSSWFFVRSIEERTSRDWWLYTLCAVLMVYTHFYGILIVAAQGLSLIFLPRAQLDRARFLRSLRFFGYALLPLSLFLWRTGSQPLNWIPPLNVHILAHFFRSLAGNGGNLLLAACIVAWLAAALSGFGLLVRQQRSVAGWRHAFLLASFAFPILAVATVCPFTSAFLARYLILCLPASVLLAAAGISGCRPAWVRTAFLAVIVALSVGGVFSYYRADFDIARDDWRSASHYLLAHASPGDGIFFYTSPGRFSFEYYRLLAGRPANDPLVIYPASDGRVTYRDFLVSPLGEVLQNPLPEPKRVWLFLNNHRAGGRMDMGSEVMCAYYARRYRLLSKHTVDGLDLLLYEREQ
ncbi:MAG: glycosyltransferase family 39 protein [Terriglobales bacterium]